MEGGGAAIQSRPPEARGQADPPWRQFLHGEHSGEYRYDDGMHYLTDGGTKYIWYSQTGREHLFDLDSDPNELNDLARDDTMTRITR